MPTQSVRPITQQLASNGVTPGFMPAFGKDNKTEALPGALLQGMNSPQKCDYGLYAEQLSGTAFAKHPSPHMVLSDLTVRQTLGPLYEDRYALLEKRAMQSFATARETPALSAERSFGK